MQTILSYCVVSMMLSSPGLCSAWFPPNVIITIKTKTFSLDFISPDLVSDSLRILQVIEVLLTEEKLLSGSSDWWDSGIISPMHTGPQSQSYSCVLGQVSYHFIFR